MRDLGRYDEPIENFKMAWHLSPSLICYQVQHEEVCAIAGREADGKEVLEQVLAVSPELTISQIRERRGYGENYARELIESLRLLGSPE